ncbi:hypothetical protein JVU11DRAFT_9466 [Chiua virens]|nr:hypothetical protein JVU11DRAFT_9466 [Chiua virens]
MHEFLVKFIVVDDQSLNVIECPEFRHLILFLCQDLHDTDIPRHMKLHELILEAWQKYFKVIKRELVNAAGKVSFTCGIWSDDSYCPFLAITAHWIAVEGGSLRMKALLIAFHYFPTLHTGKALAQTILELLDQAEVTLKIGHFTMDNVANNIVAMRELAKLLEERK